LSMSHDSVMLGYIAGLIDGEGAIGLQVCGHGRKRKDYWLSPYIAISNSNRQVLEVCKNFLKCGYIQTCGYTGKRRRRHWRLWIKRQDDCLKVLEMIKDFLIAKKTQCELLIKYLKRRCRLPKYRKGIGYTEEDFEIYLQLRRLNNNGKQRKLKNPRLVNGRIVLN